MGSFRVKLLTTAALLWTCCSVLTQPISSSSPSHVVRCTEGESRTFVCSYGNSRDVKWTYTSSSTSNSGETTIRYLEQLWEVDLVNTLTISNISQQHDGTYRCVTSTDKGNTRVVEEEYRLIVHPVIPSHIQLLNVVQNGVGFLSLSLFLVIPLIVILVALLSYKLNSVTKGRGSAPNSRIYVSHCSTTQEQKQQLIRFSHWLESQIPGLHVVIDLRNKSEIKQVGGLSQWIPQQISNVDKVLVVLCEDYVNALKNITDDFALKSITDDVQYDPVTSQTLKVLAEYSYIEKTMKHIQQMSDKLIVCWKGGDLTHLPIMFQRRSYYLLPKFTQGKVLRDNACVNILAAVKN